MRISVVGIDRRGMPKTFTSPGYFVPGVAQCPLSSVTAVAMHMAHEPGGLEVDTQVKALWKVLTHADVEWAEIAIASGPPVLDVSGSASPLRYLGALDVASSLALAEPDGRVLSSIPISVGPGEPIYPSGPMPEDVWLVIAAKHGVGTGAIGPVLAGSWGVDHLASGLVGVAIGHEQRPSHCMAIGQVVGFSSHTLPRPFQAVIQLP